MLDGAESDGWTLAMDETSSSLAQLHNTHTRIAAVLREAMSKVQAAWHLNNGKQLQPHKCKHVR